MVPAVAARGKSHPTWVRGLKHFRPPVFCFRFWSHPTWVRGLKQKMRYDIAQTAAVAPYVGAWIET